MSRLFFVVLASLASASIASASFFDAAPHDYVSTPFPPAADTFYFNDFNGYGVAPAGSGAGAATWYRSQGQALVGDERGSRRMVNPITSTYPSRLEIALGYGGTSSTTRNSAFDPDRDSGGRGPDFGAEVVGDLQFDARSGVLRFLVSTLSRYSGTTPRGVQFNISTAGYSGVRLSFDFAQSQSGNSGFFQFRASADGGATWSHVETVNPGSTNTWYDDFVFDLSAYPEFDDNAFFVFQLLAIPNPATGAWENVDGGAISGGGGGFAIDRLAVAGTALPTATPLQQWRQTHLGSLEPTGDAADDFDADGDGLVNLLEYALGGLPRDPGSAPHPAPSTTSAPDKLRLTFTRRADPALRYEVEAASGLDPVDWSVIWSSEGAQNLAGPVEVDDVEELADHPRRFLRLRVRTP